MTNYYANIFWSLHSISHRNDVRVCKWECKMAATFPFLTCCTWWDGPIPKWLGYNICSTIPGWWEGWDSRKGEWRGREEMGFEGGLDRGLPISSWVALGFLSANGCCRQLATQQPELYTFVPWGSTDLLKMSPTRVTLPRNIQNSLTYLQKILETSFVDNSLG